MENNYTDFLMSEKIDSLAIALSKAQSIIENVDKTKQAYGYKYADLANCLQAIRKPLADNGLSISQLVAQDKENKQVLITLLIHESGQWLKSVFGIENVVMKQCNSLQQIGAGITYARRYALSAIIGLAQEDDDAYSVPKFKNTEEDKILAMSIQKDLAAQDLATQLSNICKSHALPAGEFAKFHGITSNNPETIKNGIENFEVLKEKFLQSKNVA